MKGKSALIAFGCLLIFSCQEKNNQPKPKAFLALDYQTAKYKSLELECPYQFKINQSIAVRKIGQNTCDIKLIYPRKKASVFISYKSIDNNLKKLLVDAQKIPTKHQIKADAISVDVYENEKRKIYGNFYKVAGNAASQAQFYVTDSINHFLTASLYFNAVPNYDSVYPASEYIIKDMKKMMESMKWMSSQNDSLLKD
ncbi:MAG: gliding motility lipoprotein GldD [Psychroflexus sp.]|nr:gliding motility lipoprotein GldD [Psychroflexus sp.]MDR9448919.1 gliding motility lipoprotein GldD [Psychroflexus sp.]